MNLAAFEKLLELAAEAVLGVRRDVVEFVDGDHPIVEGFDAEAFDGEAEGRVRAYEELVVTLQKFADRSHLPRFRDRGIAEVPTRLNAPIRPKAVLHKVGVAEARADGALRYHDDALLQPLVLDLVKSNEHQRAGLARRGRRLDEQVLFPALLVGAFLHGTHPELVRFLGFARRLISDVHSRDHFGHLLSAFCVSLAYIS